MSPTLQPRPPTWCVFAASLPVYRAEPSSHLCSHLILLLLILLLLVLLLLLLLVFILLVLILLVLVLLVLILLVLVLLWSRAKSTFLHLKKSWRVWRVFFETAASTTASHVTTTASHVSDSLRVHAHTLVSAQSVRATPPILEPEPVWPCSSCCQWTNETLQLEARH